MSEKQFKLSKESALQYVIMKDNVDLNENEVVDCLNEQQSIIEKQNKIIKEQNLRIYCQDKQIQKLEAKQ